MSKIIVTTSVGERAVEYVDITNVTPYPNGCMLNMVGKKKLWCVNRYAKPIPTGALTPDIPPMQKMLNRPMNF